MTIYRIEILVSYDSCTEFWENVPLTDFYTSRAKAENELKRLRELPKNQLYRLSHGGYFSSNIPVIEAYDLDTEE